MSIKRREEGSPATNLKSRFPGIEKHLLINENEVAEITGISRGTLSRWRCAGKGPTWVKLEGLVRYYLSDILSYIEARKVLSVEESHRQNLAAQKRHQ
jgi:predicted DNA-binding transcriptional regulator AlpA